MHLLELLLDYAVDTGVGSCLDAAVSDLFDSARKGPASLVEKVEAVVRAAKPGGAFTFDPDGFATLNYQDHTWHAGRFTTPTLAELRRQAEMQKTSGSLRLWVFDGVSPLTDVGGLQATAPADTLFQAASQFNCLESPGPYLVPVARYFQDSTQGPRAALSAFPGTLLRHYAAPGPHGNRFVQTDKQQLNLLAEVFGPEVAPVQSGYLLAATVRDPGRLLTALTERFDFLRVGVHEQVQVVLGYDFRGAVEPSPLRRIAQVYTSTIANGGRGGVGFSAAQFHAACEQFLRAAYLGTLLAAITLKQRRVVLTLIGGGVFGNPIPLIWNAIRWALAKVEPLLSGDLDVVVNGRNLGSQVPHATILPVVRQYAGALLEFGGPRPRVVEAEATG